LVSWSPASVLGLLLKKIKQGELKMVTEIVDSVISNESIFEQSTLEDEISHPSSESTIPPNEVEIVVPYDDHKIKAVILWNGKRWLTRFTKDEKEPLGIDYKKQLYIADRNRDTDIIRWLKQKFNCKKSEADLILDMIRSAADEKQKEIDALPDIQAGIEAKNKAELKVPGYEEYKLYTLSENGTIIPDIDAIAEALIEKLEIVSYDKSIWEYKNGIYCRDDRQTHEEIIKIFKYLSYNGATRSNGYYILHY
jgi:succinate dehydrogenase flavin-adding protein (antitoxin of CptAB toxin-antitoxin module)